MIRGPECHQKIWQRPVVALSFSRPKIIIIVNPEIHMVLAPAVQAAGTSMKLQVWYELLPQPSHWILLRWHLTRSNDEFVSETLGKWKSPSL